VVDVVGVGADLYDRLVELSIPVTPDNGRTVDFRGHIKIESKDDMRKRAFRRPTGATRLRWSCRGAR
jgi:hypothetical protein